MCLFSGKNLYNNEHVAIKMVSCKPVYIKKLSSQ